MMINAVQICSIQITKKKILFIFVRKNSKFCHKIHIMFCVIVDLKNLIDQILFYTVSLSPVFNWRHFHLSFFRVINKNIYYWKYSDIWLRIQENSGNFEKLETKLEQKLQRRVAFCILIFMCLPKMYVSKLQNFLFKNLG